MILLSAVFTLSAEEITVESDRKSIFDKSNLVAWCIVPFDAEKRGPEERAAMLDKLGIPKLAYDWRKKHIPTFDAEVQAMKERGIEMTAWWFPSRLNDDAKAILNCIKRNDIHPQLWVMLGGGEHLRLEEAFESTPGAQEARVRRTVEAAKPIAAAAKEVGCEVALYNHGGWFGVPENQIEVIKRLKSEGVDNVGMVYTQHHGHGEIPRFAELMPKMKPYLLAITLNGMFMDGDRQGKQMSTIPIGQGDQDLKLLRIIKESGWKGPVGIILEVHMDAEPRLQDNLEGLAWIDAQLKGDPVGPKPEPISWEKPNTAPASNESRSAAFGKALSGGMVVDGKSEYRTRPLTVEAMIKANSSKNYNIIVASDTKQSAEHWELYTHAGALCLFQPGRGGVFKSNAKVTNGKWHHVAAFIGEYEVKLYIDGERVLRKETTPRKGAPMPSSLSFGRLVEGGIGFDGLIDEVRISRGERKIAVNDEPLVMDEQTLGLWNFENSSEQPPEPPLAEQIRIKREKRARLPEFQMIPAATTSELTPANGWPDMNSYSEWSRSHGGPTSNRYSTFKQINRSNVKELTEAWTYHSGDGAMNIQCNPIIVDGVIYLPTAGGNIAAVDGATGREIWKEPLGEGPTLSTARTPAKRGLLYWKGDSKYAPRLIVGAGRWIYALDPKTGKTISSFGDRGRTPIQAGTAAGGAVYENILVVPGFQRDVFGYNVGTGEQIWRFSTLPTGNEVGADTWIGPVRRGANSWGGMALDESRGIAYVATGSPKPNFIGKDHLGDNQMSDSVIALNALTGELLWHFQEIRHDIWDMDIPASPNLVTVMHNGKRVDAVAQVTKLGNTLLLDRVSGKPLYPFHLRRAPISMMPGEETSPYQPDLRLPEPFARQEFTKDDITDRTPEAAAFVENKLVDAKMGWFEPMGLNYPTAFFGIHGGAEWTGASFDPSTGHLFVSTNHIPWTVTLAREQQVDTSVQSLEIQAGEEVYRMNCAVCHGANKEGMGMFPPLLAVAEKLTEQDVDAIIQNGRNSMPPMPQLGEEQRQRVTEYLFAGADSEVAESEPQASDDYTFTGYNKLLDHEGYPGSKPPWGTLDCIDLNTGKKLWSVPLGEYAELSRAGIPQTGQENFGGPTVTAGGLIFVSGTRDNKIRAFDSNSGEELWFGDLPVYGTAPPSTYEVGGRQFVILPATGGGKLGEPMGDAWVAFALPE